LLFNPYDRVKLQKFKPEPKNVMHTIAELDALEKLTDLPYNIAMIRDRYLYSCYTGLRISDNLALLKTDLTDTPDGYVVNLHTIKGYGHDLIHPIGLMFDGRPDTIARRWITAHTEATLFPTISRAYISTVLLVLADMAKIKKHLTFHVARHTCASLLADISQNPYLIMNVLGHADIKTSMTYIHASPEGTKKQFRILQDWKEKAR
jgi:integrase